MSDNAQWNGLTISSLNTQLAADPQGFTLDNVSFTGAAAGTSYLIEPTRNAISGLGLNSAVIADNRLIAAAVPMRTEATGTNSGKATISAGSVSTGYKALDAARPLILTYNNATNTMSWPATLAGDGVTTIPAGSVVYASGATISIAGNNFAISGSPNTGDTFSIAKNSSGTTDARNAALLGKLQTQNTMAGQTASYQTAYAALVSSIGNKTREISTTGDAQQALLDQATAARDAVSGVNTDEEAANLIVFQEAYQASAKVIEVASKLFDTLLAIN